MGNTIDDVIRSCAERYKLLLDDESAGMYRAFLGRQQEEHNYDLDLSKNERGRPAQLYFELLVDKLLLFSVLARRRKVSDEFENEKFVDSYENLELFRVKGAAAYLWDDSSLCHAYIRRIRAEKNHNLMKYTEILDELGQDPEVVLIWGAQLNYAEHIGKNRKKILK